MFSSSFIHRFINGANEAVDSLLYRLSVYGVPVAIATVSILALFAWEKQYPAAGATPLEFRVLEQSGQALEPAQALAHLSDKKGVPHHDTRLSERPFWFSFDAPLAGVGEPASIEFPSRHATEVACWDAAGRNLMGRASRKLAEGRMRPAKAGFALDLEPRQSPETILCRGSFVGPARISVAQWTEPQLEVAIREFHRNAGALDGGVIVLSIFVLLTAVINREWLYVLFAAWLMSNLRLAALSEGWDMQWLTRTIPAEWIFFTRKISIAAYYTLTYMLFSRLFRDDLKQVGYAPLLRITLWSCLPLLLAAAFLPYAQYLPFMWLTAAFGSVVLAFFVVRILLVTRSVVAMWYGAAMGIALFASLYEVIAAALGAKYLIGAINSLTAALASSLLAALAIAEQMRQDRREKMKAQAELRSTYEAIPIGLFTLNEQGFFLRGNPALKELLGVELSGSMRHHWRNYFEADAWDRLKDLASMATSREIEIRSIGRSGREPKWFSVKATTANSNIEGSLQDVTERYRATERLRFLAENDPLTGVLNRRGIEKILDETITAVALGRPLAIAYLDLDRFKLINDLFGHPAGDEVLKQLCLRVKEMLGEGQEVGRVGGDEFVIVFRDTLIGAASVACRTIVEKIGTIPYQIGERAFQVRGSIGLIEVGGGVRVKDAISAADRACRAAKGGHDGGLVVYEKDAPLFIEREEELRLIERFGAGVAPEGLFLVMQPIMSLRAPYDSLNFELLLRMREPEGAVLPAGKVISAAENNGRIAVIDRWVLSNTLEWLDAYARDLKRTRFVCMNLSGASLNDERFIQDAFSMLAQAGPSVERLCVEITESVALHDLNNTRRFIDRVRSFGARIALDDFGAGYTSFSYLKELPADAVKIDGAFVRDVNRHPANLAIVEAIAELAHDLGMITIGEWAEDCATVEALSEVGVDYVQGYAISGPQPLSRALGAQSSASFIEDEKVALYLRNALAAPQKQVQ